MSKIDLSRVDLNLLVTFEVLMREMNVTRAAEELGRTQSAVSHSLAKLRDQLGDPLLIKSGGRMTPTPYALKLIKDIVPILRSLQTVIALPEPFVPATSNRHFQIVSPVHTRSFLTNVFSRVQREAPGVSVEWRTPTSDIFPLLVGGQIDICAMGRAPHLADGLDEHPVQRHRWMTYVRKDHPAAQDWGPAAWQKWPHVKVNIDNRTASPVDDVEHQGGLSRRIGAWVPDFGNVGPLLAETDFMATLPPTLMIDAMNDFDLLALKPPVEITPLAQRFVWSLRLSNDPGSRWFRNLVIEVYTDLQKQAETEHTARWLERTSEQVRA